MSKIDTSSWKKFKISELFGNAKLGKYHNPADLRLDPDGYDFICASNLNNGINKDMPKVNGEHLSLTPFNIIAWGKQCPMFAYHKNPCVTSQGMYYIELPEIITEEMALFIITLLEHACSGNYGYNNCLIGSKFDELEILLPVTAQDVPDWDYMQERIAELEQERIAELEQYLVATGLNDYTLTEDDLKVLSLSDSGRDEDGNPAAYAAVSKPMMQFKLDMLFKAENGDVDLQQKDVNGKGAMLVSSGESNTGVIGKTDVPAKIVSENTITVDMFGSVQYRCFPYKMVTHARVFALVPKEPIDQETGLFLTTLLQKLTSSFSYNNMCSWNKVKDFEISLPVTDTGKPDWEYMTAYIRAVEKLVIKDVVDYKDEFIRQHKMVVAGSEVREHGQRQGLRF